MVTKTDENGKQYDVEKGRWFVWHAEVWEDEGETPFDVRLPLRMKTSILFDLVGANSELDLSSMKVILEAIAPDAREQMSEMDLNDFQAMFGAWNHEYELLSGASLGESARSSA